MATATAPRAVRLLPLRSRSALATEGRGCVALRAAAPPPPASASSARRHCSTSLGSQHLRVGTPTAPRAYAAGAPLSGGGGEHDEHNTALSTTFAPLGGGEQASGAGTEAGPDPVSFQL